MAFDTDHPNSWYAATAHRLPPFPQLNGTARADVCIIGGGYTGLSAALHLAEAGFDVALLEASGVGTGASGRNGGQIHSGQRRDQDWLEAQVGLEDAKKLWRLAEDAKALLHDLIARHGIDCDLRPGLIIADHKPAYAAHSHAYARKLNEVYGYDQAAPLSREQLREMVGTDAYCGGMIDHGGGHLHPLNLALGLAEAACRAGARIFEHSRALAIEEGAKVRVVTVSGAVEADWVLECGDGLQDGLDRRLDAYVMPIANYIAATEPLGARAKDIIANDAAVSDSRFVVNYYRLSSDGRLLFGGGESYTRRLRPNPGAFVRPYMLKVFPQLADVRIDYGWGGILGITMSRMPFVRRLSPRVLTAAGYSGHGVVLAPYFGKLLGEAIAGQLGTFDLLAGLPVPPFPGGPLMRWPLLVAGLSYYALRDRL
ncbi:NAD(P)/FAD-dependent oxidoreductase [Ancylobacter amanitiformis]|uniref:Gamma-glutamylputrescine oxidase n=1 Tax=Ancylobacter amanitiformis TaxID=217069 RepID=A0ABU0LVG8_9HYPH|nr:FAD-binding oxidoreductase [Ancylobacter amanitiformis]MDQ0512673.1 gamma-glutamylputrescine oxidase [Ancylobacter amanitiformis]